MNTEFEDGAYKTTCKTWTHGRHIELTRANQAIDSVLQENLQTKTPVREDCIDTCTQGGGPCALPLDLCPESTRALDGTSTSEI